MPKVLMTRDELYPVPVISEHWGTVVDIPQVTLDGWNNALESFYHYRNILLDCLEEAEKQELLEKSKDGKKSYGFRAIS